jgi:hypothetical protein
MIRRSRVSATGALTNCERESMSTRFFHAGVRVPAVISPANSVE